MLIILGGLPGTGKTTVARALAARTGAGHLRIDSIEHALRGHDAGPRDIGDLGYRAAYAMAEEQLRAGSDVVADSVNPLGITRDAWAAVAARAGVPAVEVEVICSDRDEHRRRVMTRSSDIDGFTLPTWEEVEAREYEPWPRERLVIDTAVTKVADAVDRIREAVAAR